MLAEFIASRFKGRPYELYRFVFGPRSEDRALYTDAETEILFNGEIYSPVPIDRDSTASSGTLDKTALAVRMPQTLQIPQLYRIYPPGYTVALTIFRGESLDPDAQRTAVWVGRVVSVAYEGLQATVQCEPIVTAFRRTGLRRNYQYMCPHILYGPQCKANKAAASTSAVVSSATGRSVVLSTVLANANLYLGGMLEWTDSSGTYQARTILSVGSTSGGTTFTLTGLATGLLPGAAVTPVRGCRHVLSSCVNEHNNGPNYGGYPWIPLKNPIGNLSLYD